MHEGDDEIVLRKFQDKASSLGLSCRTDWLIGTR